MKKILTLMAAMSAASGAFAHDLNLNIGEAPQVDSNGYVYGGYDTSLKFEGNKFTFTSTAGDEVDLTMAGEKVQVTVNGATLNTTFENGHVKFNVGSGGEVVITLGEKTYLENITIESSNYRALLEEIKTAKENLNKANVSIAKYVTMDNGKFADFYTAVKGQLNNQGQVIENIANDIENAKKEDNVHDASKAGFTERIDRVKTDIEKTLDAADNAKKKYDMVAITWAESLNKRIARALTSKIASTTETAVKLTNKRNYYINDFDKNGNVTGLKAPWCEAELNLIISERDAIIQKAMDRLVQFPVQTQELNENAQAECKAAFDKLITGINNMIARAIFERDNSKEIKNLGKQAAEFDGLVEKTDIYSKPEGYDTWREGVGDLQNYTDTRTDNRRDLTLDELNAKARTISGFKTTTTSLKASFANDACTSLKKHAAEGQKEIDEIAYKITAKYQNEPDVQKKYETLVGKEQSDLNDTIKVVEQKNYNVVVRGYDDKTKQIDEIVANVKKLWGDTQSEQIKAVKTNNEAMYNKLITAITDTRTFYNAHITDIETWIAAPWTSEDKDDVALKAHQVTLFGILGDLDNITTKVETEKQRVDEALENVSDAEFEVADPTEYRLLKSEENVKSLIAQIENLEAKIQTHVKASAVIANKAALDYLFTSKVQVALDNIKEAKKDVVRETVAGTNNIMSESAFNAFNNKFDAIGIYSNGIYYGYIQTAVLEKVNELYSADEATIDLDKQDLANHVDEYAKICDQTIPSMIQAVSDQLVSYKKQFALFFDAQSRWSNVYGHANDIAKEQGKTEKQVLGEINAINAELKTEINKLEGDAVNASDYWETTKAAIEKFNKAMFEYEKSYNNNVKNKELADKQISEAESALAKAFTDIEDYEETVKSQASSDLNNQEAQLKQLKQQVEEAYASIDKEKNLGAIYETEIKANLQQVIDNITQIVKDAAEANEKTNLDVTGDGKVSSADLIHMQESVIDPDSGVDGATYNKFLDAYLKYLSK